ncbi:asparagine synthase-related protein [Rhizohabitans arisaemae]|uniref:asparagine synthase-related protein n=1 Tax=Rhizohabitans arisaemae TaxID=2720610 RepID=UPI0024B1D309|nr:asparagine synthase-related protein [Rhizohabitans arisaemae]
MAQARTPLAQRPVFIADRTGETANDPLSLIDGTPRFSLEKIAINLENPFLEAEFPPACPWEGVSRLEEPVSGHRPGSSSVSDLRDAFRDAVKACIGEADVVAVMYSGGLDSTSVLVTAAEICRAEGRRLLAIVWNLDDQYGVPTGQLAHRQLKAMEVPCELKVMPVDWRSLPEPGWSPAGIRIDYYTRLHRAMVDLVAAEGAEVLLTGVGGDEVLAAWQFMTPDLVAARRWRDLRGYQLGFVKGDTVVELMAEVVSGGARALPPERSFDLYAAFAFGRQLRPLPSPVVTDRFRPVVEAAARRWRRARFERFAADRQTWSQASLWDSIYPLAYAAHPAGVPIYEASPFLEPSFIRYALGLPIADRFRYSKAPPYHWYKPLHFRLLPESYLAVAPTYKQSYSHIFREYELDMLPDDGLVSVDLGLVRPLDKRDLDRIHPRLPAALRNVEQWIRGALAFGAEPC